VEVTASAHAMVVDIRPQPSASAGDARQRRLSANTHHPTAPPLRCGAATLHKRWCIEMGFRKERQWPGVRPATGADRRIVATRTRGVKEKRDRDRLLIVARMVA
jgi:hypothetical protein